MKYTRAHENDFTAHGYTAQNFSAKDSPNSQFVDYTDPGGAIWRKVHVPAVRGVPIGDLGVAEGWVSFRDVT